MIYYAGSFRLLSPKRVTVSSQARRFHSSESQRKPSLSPPCFPLNGTVCTQCLSAGSSSSSRDPLRLPEMASAIFRISSLGLAGQGRPGTQHKAVRLRWRAAHTGSGCATKSRALFGGAPGMEPLVCCKRAAISDCTSTHRHVPHAAHVPHCKTHLTEGVLACC